MRKVEVAVSVVAGIGIAAGAVIAWRIVNARIDAVAGDANLGLDGAVENSTRLDKAEAAAVAKVKADEPVWWCVTSGLCYFQRARCRANTDNEGCYVVDAPFCYDITKSDGTEQSSCMRTLLMCKDLASFAARYAKTGDVTTSCYRADKGRARDIAVSYQ